VERPARYGELAIPLPEPIAHALTAHGIGRPYTHQVQAIQALMQLQAIGDDDSWARSTQRADAICARADLTVRPCGPAQIPMSLSALLT
jgi:hypothetical protein